MKNIYLSILYSFVFFSAKAQEPTSPLSLSGYVDTYYFANFNGVTSNLGASGFERIFDQKANNFQLGMAQLKTTYEAGPVTGVIDLTFGNHSDLANYGNTQSPLGEGIGSTGLAIKQAYVAWAMNEKVSFTAGQYGTHVGYEVIDAPVNFNYSLSNLFGNGPFYHTGIKMDVAVSDAFAFMVGVNNGLDSKDDNNKPKGIAAQVYLAPVEGWDLYLNYYGTKEGKGTELNPYYTYNWFDITTTYAATDKLLIGLNAVPYGGQKAAAVTKSWWGAALYVDASLSEKFGLGLRAEHFDNSEGGIYLIDTKGSGTAVTSLTLTGSMDITKNLIFKPELRFDTYSPTSGYQLTDRDGWYRKNNQTTLGAAMIFHF